MKLTKKQVEEKEIIDKIVSLLLTGTSDLQILSLVKSDKFIEKFNTKKISTNKMKYLLREAKNKFITLDTPENIEKQIAICNYSDLLLQIKTDGSLESKDKYRLMLSTLDKINEIKGISKKVAVKNVSNVLNLNNMTKDEIDKELNKLARIGKP